MVTRMCKNHEYALIYRPASFLSIVCVCMCVCVSVLFALYLETCMVVCCNRLGGWGSAVVWPDQMTKAKSQPCLECCCF